MEWKMNKYGQLAEEHSQAIAEAKKFGRAMVNSRYVDADTIKYWIGLREKAVILNLRLVELEAEAAMRGVLKKVEAFKADAVPAN